MQLGNTPSLPSVFSLLRLVPDEELSTLSPEVPDDQKKIVVDLSTQLVSAFEGEKLVFSQRCASGVRGTATPKGEFRTYHKGPSVHMTNEGDAVENESIYSLPGVPWCAFFTGAGMSSRVAREEIELVRALDANGVVQKINRYGAAFLACDESEIVGKNWFEGFVANHAVDTVPIWVAPHRIQAPCKAAAIRAFELAHGFPSQSAGVICTGSSPMMASHFSTV